MSEIKCLILDVGNVLIKYPSYYVCTRLARLSVRSQEEVRALIFGKDVWGPETPSYQFDIGLLDTDAFMVLVRKTLGIDFPPMGPSDQYLRGAFNNCFEFDGKIRRLLWFLSDKEKCPRRIVCGILSNNNELQWGYTLSAFPTLKLKPKGTMDFHIVSFLKKMVKPMRGIYAVAFTAGWRAHYAETKGDLKPSECLFLDDRLENVEAAEEFGMQSEFVEDYGYSAFAKILEFHDIPLPPPDYKP